MLHFLNSLALNLKSLQTKKFHWKDHLPFIQISIHLFELALIILKFLPRFSLTELQLAMLFYYICSKDLTLFLLALYFIIRAYYFQVLISNFLSLLFFNQIILNYFIIDLFLFHICSIHLLSSLPLFIFISFQLQINIYILFLYLILALVQLSFLHASII